MFLFSHCLCEAVIDLMFDLDISLFMLSMCNTIIRYFDCSLSLLSFYVFTHACHCTVYLFGGLR